MDANTERSLRSGFLASCQRWPDRPALEFEGKRVSYAELYRHAAAVAATLNKHRPAGDPPLTFIFGAVSLSIYAGILGTLFRGHGYAPLNAAATTYIIRTVLRKSGCRTVVADTQNVEGLAEAVSEIDEPLLILFPECEDVSILGSYCWSKHTVLTARDLVAATDYVCDSVSEDAIAYMMFTSGSTGEPKAVAISHRNVCTFLDAIAGRYAFSEEDRFSQVNALGFDLSVLDLFAAWQCGGCVCVPNRNFILAPGEYIDNGRLTVWNSTPTVATLIRDAGMLKPGQHPTLRVSLFCGERLSVELARAWALSAPNSIVDNVYGPTEFTVFCTGYSWDPERTPQEAENATVPIGEPFPGTVLLVVDESLTEVAEGEIGELLMTGPQLTLGYWRDPEKTAEAFIVPPGKDAVYYRTGDRVRRPSPGRPMTFLGRIDNQMKIRGSRVELGAIEAIIREEAGIDTAVAVGWPVTERGADGIVAFIAPTGVGIRELRKRLATKLHSWILPRKIYVLDRFPMNANGKIDRKALMNRLEAGDENPREDVEARGGRRA